jgi:outer membrane receptor for ferrienterochelin and colicins
LDAGTEARIELLESSLVLVGLEYTNDQEAIRTNTFVSNTTGLRLEGAEPEVQAFTNMAAYVQGLWRELEWLQLSANLRYDNSNQFGSNFNYRVGAVLALGPDARVKLLSGSSYRGPTPEQLYGTPVAPGDIVGSQVGETPESLAPQTALVHELFLSNDFKGEHTTLRTQLSGFYTSIDNRIEFVREAGQLTPENTASSRTLGSELAVTLLQDQLLDLFSVSATASVSYQETEIDLDEATLTPREVTRLGINELYPPWMYKAHFSIHAPAYYVRLYAQLVAYSERPQSQINQTYGRPFADSEPHTLPPTATADFALSTSGVYLLGPEQETIVALSLKDAFNSQGSEPGFNGVNLPSLGRRAFLTIRQDF